MQKQQNIIFYYLFDINKQKFKIYGNIFKKNSIYDNINICKNIIKQQFETVKQTAIQTKTSTIGLAKENVALKTQVENLRKELTETKELVAALQNLTMDNSQKILDLSIGANIEYEGDFTSFQVMTASVTLSVYAVA